VNILEIIGNAVLDEKFRKELLVDPLGTAEKYGFQLNYAEAVELSKLNDNERLARELDEEMTETQSTLIEMGLCPRRPCPWIIYHPKRPDCEILKPRAEKAS